MSETVGYTTGVFDLFHVGHLNVIRNASCSCDKLIVGVTTDELAERIKSRRPIIPFEERIEIVGSIKYVDEVVAEEVDDKYSAWSQLGFNVIFKGDDWKGTDKWVDLERRFAAVGVKVAYFPYTKDTSSSIIRSVLERAMEPAI